MFGFLIVATTSSMPTSENSQGDLTPELPAGADSLADSAVIAIRCVSGFEFGNKANNFRNAWRILYEAIPRFEEEPTGVHRRASH